MAAVRHRLNLLRPILFTISGALLIVLAMPYVVSTYHLEAGGRALDVPAWAEDHLRKAIKWDPNNAQIYRLLGKVYREQKDWAEATEALARCSELRPDNPLGHIELAESYEANAAETTAVEAQSLSSQIVKEWRQAGLTVEDFINAGKVAQRAGQDEKAGVWFERALRLEPEWEDAYRLLGETPRGDTLAVNYLEAGSSEALEKAHLLRPGDLYINYHLWQEAKQLGDLASATVYSEALTYFPLEAIDPADKRLLAYAVQVIPHLLEDDLWDREKTLNAVSFLVWQHYGVADVEQLLEQLIVYEPLEPEWPFCLGELHHRRGDLDRAETAYRRVLEVDSNYAQAYLRLGMVNETRCNFQVSACTALNEAVKQYEQYNKMAPNDFLGLKKLLEVYEELERPEAESLREELESKIDGRHIVAESLGLQVKDVELGPNLVENGDFQAWEGAFPAGWRVGIYLGQDRDRGLYATGKDDLVPEGTAARIVALWGELMPDGTITYAEYLGTSSPSTETRYLVSLYYSSRHFTEGSGLFIVGEYEHPHGLALAKQRLSDSNGQWRIIHILADDVAASMSVGPLVRVGGVGDQSVWAVEIRPVFVHSESIHE